MKAPLLTTFTRVSFLTWLQKESGFSSFRVVNGWKRVGQWLKMSGQEAGNDSREVAFCSLKQPLLNVT
jgi:hypothetical protein